jgi:hypothetical protein
MSAVLNLCHTAKRSYKQLKKFSNTLAPRKWDTESLIVDRLLGIVNYLPERLALSVQKILMKGISK